MLFPAVDRIARMQHGLITRSQLVNLGVPPGTIDTWVAARRLIAVHAGVYRLAGVPTSPEQVILAAVLAAGPGAVASHRAAAWLWGMAEDWCAEVTVPRHRFPRLPGIDVHRSRDLTASTVRRRRRIPATDPMRVLVDLGTVVAPAVVQDALERGLAARLFTVASVEAAYDSLSRHGRGGAGTLRRVLDERALGRDCPDGLLEVRMARLLRAHGLPKPVFQYEVRDGGGRFVARVDFAYPELKLVIEVDGWAAHASPSALQHDLDRQNALVALGWRVLRFTWEDVVLRSAKVASRIAAQLGTLSLK